MSGPKKYCDVITHRNVVMNVVLLDLLGTLCVDKEQLIIILYHHWNLAGH